ncbi:hypothetical protein CERZMDRAFT_114565 [Cercospora zeae-maydis SCOH1-5]|uniref:Major facilitator superfamily (MFS) profile domain-containing protein n=1 Tax=Cercospora zeae-maydis SCOH1-5 TaxID=717836 RepID=A0A6A6F5L5_9PEZI|nr:hypothetical protein CERZMDRAFT_114565 [Cercospora zeae-maydis SCOH1-5]
MAEEHEKREVIADHIDRDSNDNLSDPEKNDLRPHRTISRVPGNPNYFEKDGLRTEGDGVDHKTENKKTWQFLCTVLGCAMALSASQISALLYLTIGTAIAVDLRSPLFAWMLTASNLSSGALAPFVGPLADLIGRRNILLYGGFGLSIVATILCAATPNDIGFIAGQLLLGIGNVVQDLLSLAVVAESVPTSKRPIYVAFMLLIIIPWAPGTLYSNFLLEVSWRWVGAVLAVWNFIGFVVLYIGYKEPPRVNSLGLSRREMLKRIDFVGGFIFMAGVLLILVALNVGGRDSPWTSAPTLVPLVLGFVVLIAGCFYEYFVAPWPLFPRRIVHAPRPFYCMLCVIFGAGINYVCMVVFWPIQARAVFQGSNVQTGIWTIPIGTCILGGAIIAACMLHVFKNQVNWVMVGFCIAQVIGTACLVLIDPNNIATVWGPLIIALVSVGGVLVPNQVIITIITPDDLLGSVTALTVGLRAATQAIGLAIFYNQFASKVTDLALERLQAVFISSGVAFDLIGEGLAIPEITALAQEMMTSLTAMPYRQWAEMYPAFASEGAYNELLPTVVGIFSESFEHIYYITIAFGVFACIFAVGMGSVSRYMDDHVAVKMTG